jgi:hypothetical protein
MTEEYPYSEKVKVQYKQSDGIVYKKVKIKDDIDVIKRYYKNNKLHRDNGPAVVENCLSGWDVASYWYKEGVIHREDGPAVELLDHMNDKVTHEYYINGIQYKESEYREKIVEYKKEEKRKREHFFNTFDCRLNQNMMKTIGKYL